PRPAPAAIARPTAVGVVAWGSRLPDSLEAILAAHPFVPAAEGELFRRALLDAAGARGLLVPAEAACEAVERIERPAGPPWARDQKLAAAAGWLALTSRGRHGDPRRPPPRRRRRDRDGRPPRRRPRARPAGPPAPPPRPPPHRPP